MTPLAQLGIGAVSAIAVWALGERTWPYLVIGAVMALVVWVGVFAGSYAGPAGTRGQVSTGSFALGLVVAVAFGFGLYLVGDSPVWWSVGAVIAIALVPATRLVAPDQPGSSTGSSTGGE